LIKTALAIHHRTLPRSLHVEEPTPLFDWERGNLAVVDRTRPWPSGVARAGVSSFGISGTDVHIVLEEPPHRAGQAAQLPERDEVLPLSAANASALRASARAYAELLQAEGPSVREICYTAAVGRRHHDRRIAAVGGSRQQLQEALEAFARGEPHPALISAAVNAGERGPVFVCSGQGSQWDGMSRELLRREPVFRAEIEACDRALRAHVSWSLLAKLSDPDTCWAEQPIDVIQPAIFAIQVALASYWRWLGVEPALVVGHSMGEVAAAHIAGAISLDDAALIISKRSQNLQALAGAGAMLSVELGFDAAQRWVEQHRGRVGVAASNSAHASVLSGDPDALREIAAALRAQNVFCRELLVDAAAHSPQLDPLLPEFARALQRVAPRATSRIPICSTVTGEILPASAFDAAYWVRNQREPVRFGAAMGELVRQGYGTFLELSPHPILLGPIQQVASEHKASVAGLGSLRRDEPERRSLLLALSQLYALGQPVRWNVLFGEQDRFVELPRYPFQRELYDEWPGANELAAIGGGSEGLLGPMLRSAEHPRSHLWRVQLSPAASSYLRDHVVDGAVVLPGAAYVDLALQAARQVFGAGEIALEEVRFGTALVLAPDAITALQVSLELEQSDSAAIRFHVPTADGFALHATTRARRAAQAQELGARDITDIAARCQSSSPADHVQRSERHKLSFGPAFRTFERLWLGEREALAEITLPKCVAYEKGQGAFHPVLLDASWQVSAAWVFANAREDVMYLPVAAERVTWFGEPSPHVWAHASLRVTDNEDELISDIDVFDDSGRLLLRTEGLTVQRVEHRSDALAGSLYALQWTLRARSGELGTLAQQTWLVLADETRALANELVPMLEARGARCLVAEAEHVDPDDAAAMRALVARASADPACPLAGVLDLWPVDAGDEDITTGADLSAAQSRGVHALAHLMQGLSAAEAARVKLWVVTAGAQPLAADEQVAIAAAPVWALSRVLRYEFPEHSIHTLDLSARAGQGELRALVDEICSAAPPDQIALRGERRHVLQLVRAVPAVATQRKTTAPSAFALRTSAPGVLDNLRLQESARVQPGAGQIELEVQAAGLNFIDVMKAFGIYPGLGDGPLAFGGECVGVVRAIGAGVTGFALGERVLAMADACFARYVLADAALAVRVPEPLDSADAATIPAVFLTAHYALRVLGDVRAGERVLIHSATGGVGLAALQLARRAGAEIFATAGSPEKRAFLRELGVEHVFDSRSTDFAEHILAATSGEGVDVVLNSLTGRALTLSLSLLRDDGRFLEIGKRDIYDDMQLGLLPFKRGLTFSHIDIGRMVKDKPAKLGAMLRELMAQFERGELQPLPRTTFALADAAEAFRHMAQAKHIGKIVLNEFASPELAERIMPAPDAPLCRADASYLITGGLGGLGLLVASFLAKQGARQLVLLGRSQPVDAARRTIEELQATGVAVSVMACDVSSADDVRRVFAHMQSELPPLAGVVHGAAVLDDGVTLQLTPERFARAMAPKMLGAFHLHTQTAQLPLDFFVMFSSAASALGSPGQGNYAAGNELMDALAHLRRAQGLPALSINWGPWRESGIAARPDRAGRLSVRGMGSVSDAEGIALLERLMRSDAVQSVVLPQADFRTWAEWYPAAASGMLEALIGASAAASTSSLRAEIASAPEGERHALIEAYLVEAMRRVLRVPANKELATDQPLNRFGVDSLMAVELKNRIEAELAVGLPVSKILLCTGLSKLASELLLLIDMSAAAAAVSGSAPAPAAARERLSIGDDAELLEDLDVALLPA
jgi:NADPH:quinone reductase-like Zn-dependent oxidoreductase/malonyl CoA-acyl carrier protein transacylase/short-subunit dehydrogenase